MRLSSIRRTAALMLTAGALVTTSGCFGQFNLTRKLYTFNKSVSPNKFVRELAFIGLNVVPIYSLAAFADAIFANTVEFWTGSNPVTMASTIRVDDKTKVERVMVGRDDARTMTLTTYMSGKRVGTVTIQYVTGADYMTFSTLLADGRTETHVSVMGMDGKAFVSSGTYTELTRNGFVP